MRTCGGPACADGGSTGTRDRSGAAAPAPVVAAVTGASLARVSTSARMEKGAREARALSSAPSENMGAKCSSVSVTYSVSIAFCSPHVSQAPLSVTPHLVRLLALSSALWRQRAEPSRYNPFQ